MKDLYRRINIKGNEPWHASEADVRRAIGAPGVTDWDRHAAEQILLSHRKRQHYDTVVKNLRTIGTIRSNLGLTDTASWPKGQYEDFTSSYPFKHSELDNSLRTDRDRRRDQDGTSMAGCLLSVLVVVAIPLIGTAAVRIWESYNKEKNAQRTFAELESRQEARRTDPERRPVVVDRPAPATPLPQSWALPRTGILQSFEARAVAPLNIVTRGAEHHFVKVEAVGGRIELGTIFIRSNDTARVLVPLGTYTIKYATGDIWYGPDDLFGPDTRYYKAEETFRFTSDATGYMGFTIELFRQQGGNLETQRVDESDF